MDRVLMKRMASGIADSDGLREMTTMLAKIEREQSRAVRRLADATGHDKDPGSGMEIDDRAEQLAEALAALVTDDYRSWWIDNVAPTLLKDTDGIDKHLGVGSESDDWADQVASWASKTREASNRDLSAYSDRDLAAAHLRSKRGVDLEAYENVVVDWDSGRSAERVIAGPLENTATAVDEIAANLEAEP
jgi:hypothetical protein